ncbi:MAG: hypothetical protein L0287_12470 [Anaerolineae bacterium]|nr:hypothetical protein [Anaerolineae bacterium]MCI0610627.1 hypothetical protein [Anaerolineae bacterium]
MDRMLLAYLVLIVSILLLYFPLFVLDNVERMSLNELIRLNPQFTWLKRGYQFIVAAIFLPLVVLAVYIFIHQDKFKEQFFLLFVPFVSTLSLFDGMLAFATGIYPMWVTKYTIRYWYDKEKKKTWVAEVQIGLALAMIAASLLLYFA